MYLVADDKRPLRPNGMPTSLWKLVQSCWAQEALERPRFAAIEAEISLILELELQPVPDFENEIN
jgi:hypothetical protein